MAPMVGTEPAGGSSKNVCMTYFVATSILSATLKREIRRTTGLSDRKLMIEKRRLRPMTSMTVSISVCVFAISLLFAGVTWSDPVSADSSKLDSFATQFVLIGRGTPRPVTGVTLADVPNDDGTAVAISWTLSPDDVKGGLVRRYKIFRALMTDGQQGTFEDVGDVTAGQSVFRDGQCLVGELYSYKVRAVHDSIDGGEEIFQAYSESDAAGPVSPSAQWFDWRRINVTFGVLILCLLIVYYIRQAQSGKPLFIRKIAGLEAVDDAVGRATEMGRKIFYIPGSQDMDNVQTIAGVTILGRVAELAATYDAKLDVPVSRSLVMVTAREVVREAYSKAGRPDAFHDDQVHYLTDDQFGYAAAVDGMIVREKPATIFLLGIFYAESLVLAETGNSVGAIQIAGTGEPSQLPFFVAACDYTLIGEELFAASAYLSREPRQLGSLKGQDIGKGLIIALILIGIILETFHLWEFHRLFTVIE
jgi:hypothetical protein